MRNGNSKLSSNQNSLENPMILEKAEGDFGKLVAGEKT